MRREPIAARSPQRTHESLDSRAYVCLAASLCRHFFRTFFSPDSHEYQRSTDRAPNTCHSIPATCCAPSSRIPGAGCCRSWSFTTLAALYAFLKPATWEATQALLVRDEAAGKADRPGRFSAVEEMKTAQETVLELIKSRTVLAGALNQVGPPADEPNPEPWPSDRTVESLEQTIKITPPKGAEFGKTEVFYLKVQAGDPRASHRLDRRDLPAARKAVR